MPKPRKKKGKGSEEGDGFPGGDPPAPECPPQAFDPYKAAAGLKDWRSAADSLHETVSVRTPFPDFNRAVRVGGLPVKRMHTIHGPTHGGKAQSYDSRVLTPWGWRRFGDLESGDVVTGRDGKPTTVTGFYPQGEREMFRVTTSDGASVVVCGDHLWYTTTPKERNRGRYRRGPRPERARIPTGVDGPGGVKTTRQIAADPSRFHEIPIMESATFEPCGELLLNPYLLGLLLGDGILSGSTVRFSNPEDDLRGLLRDEVHPDDDVSILDDLTASIVRKGTREASRTMQALRALGLAGVSAEDKFVPVPYLRASVSDRVALLQGLIDTDGHVHDWGTRVEYSTVSRALATDVVDLVRGLGGVASIQWQDSSHSYEGERHVGKPSARIFIWFDNRIRPFRSWKHGTKWNPVEDRRDRYRRTIVSVESVGQMECACISVDAPDSLYVTDGHVVTHNTAFVIGLLRGFIDPGFLAGYIDAERSLAKEFTGQLIGDLHERPNFVAEYPDTYEETIKIVDNFLDHAAKIVKDHPEFRCALVVDSINKLTPKRELEKYLKAGPDEISKGHQARYRAAVNQAWMDRITPKLERANCAFIAIAQEREEESTSDWVRDAFKVKGGQSLLFDASIVARVMKASPIFRGTDKKNDQIIGFRHRVRVWKSKVGHMDGRYTDCYFNLSNGKIAPPGFDTARDALEVGADLGIVKKSSSWYSYKGRRWQGIPRGAKYLREHPEKLAELLDDIAKGLDVIEGRK